MNEEILSNEGAAMNFTSQDVHDQLMTWWWYRHEHDGPDETPPGCHQAAGNIPHIHNAHENAV
jgi:hypothetical protein